MVDWAAAAERGGNAVHSAAPQLLVVVQGVSYGADLRGVYTRPIQLLLANRVVYAPHDYSWFHAATITYDDYKTKQGNTWGYILVADKAYTAPIWMSEFGTCNTGLSCVTASTGQGLWFEHVRKYLAEADIDWAYWAMNGTQARGTSRTFGAPETYGVLDPTWTKPQLTQLVDALKIIQPKVEGP